MLGYSEQFIQSVERDLLLAETEPRERAFIEFCRNLARSRPRPSRNARERMMDLGYSRPQVAEMAFVISLGCFYNRLSTLIACPPETKFERMANGHVGRLIGLAMPLLRMLGVGKRDAANAASADDAGFATGSFGPILVPLAGLPAAAVMRSALDGALASDVLGRTTKVLMFAVVARTLGCTHCETEARRLLDGEGLGSVDIDSALATLQSDRLLASEAGLLSWARDTVYYETPTIQRRTRVLACELDNSELLEAIGVASLANATVRLAMLLE
jgi:alkylhydroperoxidase family enzyme